MSSPRENFLRLMYNDSPKWFGNAWSCFGHDDRGVQPCCIDPISIMTMAGPKPGERGVKNGFGVSMDWPEGQPSALPVITKANRVVKDIRKWDRYVRFPSLSGIDWSAAERLIADNDQENYLIMCPSFEGMFEFSHDMLGFEDALADYLLEPEAMYEMLSAYTDWKIEAVGLLIDHMHPDVIHSHDDWGNKRSLFLNPKDWRAILKPLYARLYGYIKSRGVMVQHHADCVCHEIAEDMVELGIDMWQGVIPQNDIPGIIKRTKGRLCLLGGIDMQKIDFAGAPEELVRNEVRRAIDEYLPLGWVIPSVTNIVPLHQEVAAIIDFELQEYGAQYAAKHF